MKSSILNRNEVSAQAVALISRLVDLIPWPTRRQAMGDVTLTLLNAKHRVAEDVFGWNRATVELGMNESRTGILCLNDLSTRHKPKAEDKDPKLLADIREIMDPHSQAEPRLRTTLLYTHMTAQAVYDALLEKGWPKETLPTVRTISNILERHDYRLRTVTKTKVQKKRRTLTRSLKTSGK
jgi:Rhodopirellula transposase DDE domain